ncbi:MAG TPA: hypothetical protein VMT03_05015 [Polyangia bacterium]|nr:hypothetical protein [Polyangia bacterium]
MQRPRITAAAILAIAALSFATIRGASGARERQFFSARAGVGVQAAPGWTLSLHTGYPKILCLLVHPGGSRISLAVDDSAGAPTAVALAEQNRPGLAAQGLEVVAVAPAPRDTAVLDARSDRRHQVVRQIYLVRDVPWGRQAIVLTLTAPVADASGANSALDWVAAHLDLEPPPPRDDHREHRDAGRD